MKKILSLVLTVALVFGAMAAFLPAEEARAADIDMSVEVTPTELTEAGDVSLEIIITNNGDTAENATLYYDGSVIEEFGNISSGETKDYVEPNFPVSSSMLGKDITFELRYEQNGESKSVTQSVRVAKKEVTVKVATRVSVDKTSVAQGGTVQFEFTVENQGDVDITNARLTAPPLNGGSTIGEAFSLAPGRMQTITCDVAVTEDITVRPVLNYSANGENRSADFDSVSISVQEAGMNVELSADKTSITPGEEVEFTIRVTNTGSVDYRSLKIFDPSNSLVDIDSTTLEAGDTLTARKTLTIQEGGNIQFYVTAVNSGTGQEASYNSNTVEISMLEPSPSPSASTGEILALDVVADTTRLQDEKIVTFQIVVKNQGSTPLNNVVIKEKLLGTVGEIPVLELQEQTIEYEYTFEGTEAQIFEFTAEAVDESGNTIVATAVPIEVDPTTGTASGTGLNTILIIIIIVVVLIIGVTIALVILVKKEKKKQREAAMKRQGGKPNGTQGKTTAGRQIPQKGTPKQGPPAPNSSASIQRTTQPNTNKRRPIKKRGEYDDRNLF